MLLELLHSMQRERGVDSEMSEFEDFGIFEAVVGCH